MERAVIVNGITVRPSDPESMLRGWQSVAKLASDIVWKHVKLYGLRDGHEVDDLMQQAYITYDRVVRTFDSRISNNYVGYFHKSLREDLRFLYRTGDKDIRLEECDSLNRRHYDDSADDSETEEAYIPGGDAMEEAESRLEQDELQETLQSLFTKLDNDDREAIQMMLNGEKIDSTTKRKALKAARMAILSANAEQKDILKHYISYI